jgi:hypothetical protein
MANQLTDAEWLERFERQQERLDILQRDNAQLLEALRMLMRRDSRGEFVEPATLQ